MALATFYHIPSMMKLQALCFLNPQAVVSVSTRESERETERGPSACNPRTWRRGSGMFLNGKEQENDTLNRI
jgi:hypothetical protein